jgi:peroxiredoxin
MPTTPQVGRRAPNFTAIDTRGESVRLSDYKGEKNVLLVFNRGFV